MDMLVHASLREGLARALPQALIAGKPVISYDVDGAREVVLPGSDGLSAGAAQRGTAGRGHHRSGRRRRQAAAVGTDGRERFTERFRHEEMTRQLRELYQQRAGAGERGMRPEPKRHPFALRVL